MERGGRDIRLTIGHDEHEDVLFDIPRARIKVKFNGPTKPRWDAEAVRHDGERVSRELACWVRQQARGAGVNKGRV